MNKYLFANKLSGKCVTVYAANLSNAKAQLSSAYEFVRNVR